MGTQRSNFFRIRIYEHNFKNSDAQFIADISIFGLLLNVDLNVECNVEKSKISCKNYFFCHFSVKTSGRIRIRIQQNKLYPDRSGLKTPLFAAAHFLD